MDWFGFELNEMYIPRRVRFTDILTKTDFMDNDTEFRICVYNLGVDSQFDRALKTVFRNEIFKKQVAGVRYVPSKKD